jgi:hypothetical protein
METNIEKLARLEKELAEVRKSLESVQMPDVTCGNYYKNVCYYVAILAGTTYSLVNLSAGTRWTLDEGSQDEYKKELEDSGFEYVGKYEDYLKAIRG